MSNFVVVWMDYYNDGLCKPSQASRTSVVGMKIVVCALPPPCAPERSKELGATIRPVKKVGAALCARTIQRVGAASGQTHFRNVMMISLVPSREGFETPQ